jgi:hypothetical protein
VFTQKPEPVLSIFLSLSPKKYAINTTEEYHMYMRKDGVYGLNYEIITITEIYTVRVKVSAAGDGQIIQHLLNDAR